MPAAKPTSSETQGVAASESTAAEVPPAEPPLAVSELLRALDRLESEYDPSLVVALPEAALGEVDRAARGKDLRSAVRRLSSYMKPSVSERERSRLEALRESLGPDNLVAVGCILTVYLLATALELLRLNGPEDVDRCLKPSLAAEAASESSHDEGLLREESAVAASLSMSMAFIHLFLATDHLARESGTRALQSSVEAIPLRLAAALLADPSASEIPRGFPERTSLVRLVLHHLVWLKEVSSGLEGIGTGPFSHIELGELASLAQREATVCRKYGESRVDQVFEQQLALIAQSLGLFVVRTETGRRRVDLVCVSADPTEPYTFLIDAKSTRRPYALPTADQRALREYVEDVRRTLITLPPLRMVLLVGPSAASTVEAKLRILEGDLTVPVRFLCADALQKLRNLLPGPAPAGPLLNLALSAENRVLDDGYADAVAASFTDAQDAHVAFVEKMLVARGGPSLA